MVSSRIKMLMLDISHFTGKGYLKGKTHNFNARSDEALFAKNTHFHSGIYRKRLLKIGVEYKCAETTCGISEWKGMPLTLHIDHVDGDRTNNLKDNIRFICPNCHQQTTTWGNKNR